MARRILIGFALRDEARRTLEAVPAYMLERLHAIDPGVEVVYAPVAYDARLHARMRTLPCADLLSDCRQFPAAFLDALPCTEILMSVLAPVDLVERAPSLRWVANPGSGSEQFRSHRLSESNVSLTSSKGVAARSIAQFAIGQLLLLARRGPERLA